MLIHNQMKKQQKNGLLVKIKLQTTNGPKHKTTRRCSTLHGHAQHGKETVDIVTGNIEGVKSNTSFLQSLATNNRILCIQEHFLWDFETDFLCKILPNFDNLTRCHDSNDPLDGSKLPRGQGGVSILWPKLWKSNIKKIQDGNERIIAITISSKHKYLYY
jgi:hypothetical protein